MRTNTFAPNVGQQQLFVQQDTDATLHGNTISINDRDDRQIGRTTTYNGNETVMDRRELLLLVRTQLNDATLDIHHPYDGETDDTSTTVTIPETVFNFFFFF